MKYEVRECPLKFYIDFGECDGSQTCYFEVDGQKYSWWLSYAMGDLFGSMLEAVYGLFVEVIDQTKSDHIKYEYKLPNNLGEYTAIIGTSRWDDEGHVLEWTFRRDLSRKDMVVDIKIDYQFGEQTYEGQITLADLSYAVTRALTDYIKRMGFCGYHFSAIYDSVDIVHFLIVKYYALTGEMTLFKETGWNGKFVSSFDEEMELIKQNM